MQKINTIIVRESTKNAVEPLLGWLPPGSWHCIVIALWNFLLALILRFILSATRNWNRYCPVRPSTQVIPYIHSIVVKYIQPRLFNPKRVWIVVGSLGNWRCRRKERSLNWLSYKDRFLALRTIPFAREEWHTMYVADKISLVTNSPPSTNHHMNSYYARFAVLRCQAEKS